MQGKNVLLINPWIYDFAAYDMWAKPLGLLSLGAVLRQNGCRVSFIDCLRSPHPSMRDKVPKVHAGGHGKYYREIIPAPEFISDIPRHYSRYGISPEAFMHDLASVPRPDAILVTSIMTYWYPGAFEAIRLLREAFCDVPILLGGIYATLCRDHALRFSGADHVISGEGELKVLEILKLIWGTIPEYIPDVQNLDSLAYPLFDLVVPLRYVCIQTSRGCPYRCSYCASHLISPGLRRRNHGRVAEEIGYWAKLHGARDFAFYDDALLLQPETWALPMMREIINQGVELRFHCPNALHVKCITAETARAMKESGFSTIRLGLETSDPKRQSSSGAKVDNDDFLNAVAHLTKAGFDPADIGTYILCGLPGQNAEEVLKAVKFVKSAGARPIITEFSPLPGTKEWAQSCRTSRYPLAEDPVYQNNTLLPCAWEGLTMEMYHEIKREARRVRAPASMEEAAAI